MQLALSQECEALQQLVGWDGLARVDAILHELRNRPNFFLIAPRVLRVEGVHSDMLAWLLDPKGWHDLADRFANRFVRAILAKCSINADVPLAVDAVPDLAFVHISSTGQTPVLRSVVTGAPAFGLSRCGEASCAVPGLWFTWTATVTYGDEETIRIISVRRARDSEKAQYLEARERRR